MTEARVATNRRTQRLEQVEASATQLETMVSRERSTAPIPQAYATPAPSQEVPRAVQPPTPLQTPGPLSQGALSQHYSIATPPHPQGLALATQSAVNPLIDPLAEPDPWAGSTIGRVSTIGSAPPGLSHVSGISTPGVACFGASASPCVATPGVASTGPQSATPVVTGHGGHTDDTGARFKATPAKLPRLDLRTATDASKSMLAVESWLWLCSNALNTWGTQAVTIWHNAHNQAKQQHALWSSYSPAQRSLLTSPGYHGF
eukprot:6490605-Amphidinium_carterae.3